MAISEHIEEFAGRPVRDFDPDEGLTDPAKTAYRLALTYDAAEDGATMNALLDRMLEDPACGQVEALVIGNWNPIENESGAAEIIAALAAGSDRLTGLKALFFGDITYDECEISWIRQTDVTPILEAYPHLEHLRVRGGADVEGVSATTPSEVAEQLRARGEIHHGGLKTLIFESGGLPKSIVRSVSAAELPNLEHLELWLGSGYYGGDATIDDLAPILSGTAFPRLKYLGLRDCEWADALATALADAPILRRIETLDLSLGNLGDEGAVALISGGNLSGLKRLDIHHHYVSAEVIDGLKDTGVDLNAEDARDESDDDGRYIAVSE